MKRLYAIVAIIFLISSCTNIEGEFAALEELIFVGKKSPLKVPVGQYEAALKSKSKKNMFLHLDHEEHGEFKIKLTIPKGTKFPERNGRVDLRASEIKQPYDFAGEVKTQTEVGEQRYDRESCTYTRYIERCYDQCRPNRGCQRVCRTEQITVHGRRDVRFHLETDFKVYSFQFFVPDTDHVVAEFDADKTITRRVVDWEGRCF